MSVNQEYMNRELSWLKFNERVLEEAENKEVPLCERLSFASIFQTNLDEFFMVRVGSIQDQMLVNKNRRENKTNMTLKQQMDAIIKIVTKLNIRKDKIYRELIEEIKKYGIQIVDFQKISKKEGQYLEGYFEAEVAPLISPTIVGKRQPFPFLKDKEIYAIVALETKSGKQKMGIVPCSNGVIMRLVEVPMQKGKYILSEELILYFVADIFRGYKVKSKALIRVTRNADIDSDAFYGEDLDYREFVAEIMKIRKKLAPVRVELSKKIDGNVVDVLCGYLDFDRDKIFRNDSPLDLSFVYQIQDKLRKVPELFYERRTPQRPGWVLYGETIMKQVEAGDKILSFPFESIKPFLAMLHEAAEDSEVVSIKMTLYRLAKQSKIVEALIEAAENGKEVVVLVELRARFDEENNIEWSRRLEDAGCRVIYGLDGYKVHSKLCLITKKTDDGISYITQIGTGNYNEKTSGLYTDLSLLTANKQIGIEVSNIFKALLMGEAVEETERLLVAPKCFRDKVLRMMDEEIKYAKEKKEAYIGLKMNSLTDKKIMEKLIEASKAGVKIQMIIRGICCIVPGIKGKTENIEVISIVGRFLEHSRIYLFGTGERTKVYISSADFMTRNTVRRVEVATPILDYDIKKRLMEMFHLMLTDNKKARRETANGSYSVITSAGREINSQEIFYEEAYKSANGS